MSDTKKPELRFEGFNDDWEQRKFSTFVQRESVFRESSSECPGVEYEDVIAEEGRLNKNVRQKETHKTGIVFDGTQVLYGKLRPYLHNWLSPDFTGVAVGDWWVLRPVGVDKKFLYRLLQTQQFDDVANQSSGSKMPRADWNLVSNTDFIIPSSVDEQRQIAETFDDLDNLITLHQRKYEKLLVIKKSMLGKMFPKAGEKVPEIRFAGFTDDWEQRKLGELCERVTRKNITGESDLPLTIASQYGLIDQRDFFNKVVAAKDMSNYYLLKKGEFAYNKSYSNGYDFGSIKRLNAYEQGCLSTLYICFGITSDDIESDYLECFFDTLKWYSDITMICAEGARNHGLLNVDTKAFFDEVTIEMPSSKEEQRKISSYLNNLDNLITLHQREQNYLHLEKKYDWI